MFEWCSIPVIRISSLGAENTPSEALSDQIDRLGGATSEDDLPRGRSIEKRRDVRANRIEGNRRPLTQVVNAAVDIGVFGRVESGDRIDHRLRFLGRSSVIEVNERLASHQAGENREILAYPLYVEGDAESPDGLPG